MHLKNLPHVTCHVNVFLFSVFVTFLFRNTYYSANLSFDLMKNEVMSILQQ